MTREAHGDRSGSREEPPHVLGSGLLRIQSTKSWKSPTIVGSVTVYLSCPVRKFLLHKPYWRQETSTVSRKLSVHSHQVTF